MPPIGDLDGSRRSFGRSFGIKVCAVATDNLGSGMMADPYDNTQCESFMKTLKYEEVYRNEYRDLTEAHAEIGAFLEQVYKQKHLHSALGYLSPAKFEAQLAARNMEAAAPQLIA